MDEDLPMLNGACPDRLFFRGSLVGRLRPFMILSSRWLALKFFFSFLQIFASDMSQASCNLLARVGMFIGQCQEDFGKSNSHDKPP